MTDRQFILDSPEDWLFLIMGLTISAFAVMHYHPNIVEFMTMREMSSIPFSGATITMSHVYMDRLAEDYNPLRRNEIAYCGRLEGNTVRDFIVADTFASSREFSIFSCPRGFKFQTHTHPLNSKPLMSEQDKRSFLSDENTEISCIYGANILNCFTKFSGDIVRVNVVVN